jgi:hypothetical protein
MEFPLDRAQPFRHEYCKTLIWQLGVMGQGCKVGVIDTGIDLAWLRGDGDVAKFATIHAYDLTPEREGPDDVSEEHHGSRVIGDILRGAPRAEIHSLRVYGRKHAPTREELAAALEWCAKSDIRVVNLSTSFYGDGCSYNDPCPLCRAINTFALAGDLFTVVVGGDAYTLNEQAEHGDTPALCPALNSPLAWVVEGPEVVDDRAQVLKRSLESASGLSFTTAKFSGGAALLRSVEPRMDLFFTRMAIRRTCLPLREPASGRLGFGRHCFLLAFLCSEGLRAGVNKPSPPVLPQDLGAPSQRKKGAADAAVCEMLQWVAAMPIRHKKWNNALAATGTLVERIKSWAGPLDLALAMHVQASCLEALGLADQASACYDHANAMLNSYLG